MVRIHRDFTYDAEATTVSTPAAEASRRKRGVCQDLYPHHDRGPRGIGLPAA